MDNNLCTELDQSLCTFFSENPQSFHPFLWHEREALLSDSTSPYDLENNTFALFAEILSPRLGFDRSDIPQKRYYDYMTISVSRSIASLPAGDTKENISLRMPFGKC